MTDILAHRANLAGPQPPAENSLAACARALEQGFGLETDLRRDARHRFYIGHDPQPWTGENVDDLCQKLFPATFGVMNLMYWVYFTYQAEKS